MSEINVEGILERLEPYGDDCPFCHRDPYHYVDIGVGMERAAVNCCDLGNSLIQYQDEQLAAIVQLHRDSAAIIRELTASRDRASDACASVQRERDALREMVGEAVTVSRNAAAMIAAIYQHLERVEAAGGATSISGVAACNSMLKSLRQNEARTEELIMEPLLSLLSRYEGEVK